MPLSEHEQRMLDQIESALYAEDPKFASHVRGGRIRTASSKRRFQAAALFVLGIVLLITGLAVGFKPGGVPVISIVGFLFMFGGGLLFILGGSKGKSSGVRADESSADTKGSGSRNPGAKPKSGRKGGSFTSRMEDRFRRRFEQD